MPDPAKQKREKSQNHYLGGKALGRCDTYLWTRMHIDAAITLTGNRTANAVTNSKGSIPFAFALAQGRQSIDCFTTLAYGEDQCVFGHRYVPVAKFARELHFGRDMRKILKQALADPARVKRGAASAENYALDVAQFTRGHVKSAKFGGRFFGGQP